MSLTLKLPALKSGMLKSEEFGAAPLRTGVANLAGAALALALVAAGAGHARAQAGPHLWAGASTSADVPDGRIVRVGLSRLDGPARNLSLPLGKSAVIELPMDARDVIVSDPKTADVVLSTPRRIYILGVKTGQTDATFADGMGHQILRLNIRVDADTSAVAETLNRVLVGSSVHVEAVNDNLILSGQVPNASDADKAVRIAASFVEKPEQVLNMLSVAGPEQVMLKVRIVEVNRQIVKQLGVNLNAVIGQVGLSQFSFANAASWGVNGALLGGLTGGYNYNTTVNPAASPVYCSGVPVTCTESPATQIVRNDRLAVPTTGVGSQGLNQAESMLQAFEQTGLVRTLAEPNLTAVSGESAKFLAGGEFPVPVAQALGQVSVEFKTFGVGLGFTPVVLSDGRISLKLSTEYSEISNQNSFTQGSSGGTTAGSSSTSSSTSSASFTIPSLTVRRAETVVELPSGGSMMIAGLMESVNKQTVSSLPGLNELPVLGALFRSRDFLQGETELVVIVTPYLVKPVRPDQLQTPADGLQIANDSSTLLFGRLNEGINKAPLPPTKATNGASYQGPYGYVVQ
jgi:pilus assembly protein CpaC